MTFVCSLFSFFFCCWIVDVVGLLVAGAPSVSVASTTGTLRKMASCTVAMTTGPSLVLPAIAALTSSPDLLW